MTVQHERQQERKNLPAQSNQRVVQRPELGDRQKDEHLFKRQETINSRCEFPFFLSQKLLISDLSDGSGEAQ